MKNTSQSVEIIIGLLTNKQYCPSVSSNHLTIKTLYTLAVRNKVAFLLRHFLTCPLCHKTIRPNWKTKIAQTLKLSTFRNLYLRQELIDVEKIFKQHRLRGVLFKWQNQNSISGSDIDILVSQKDFTRTISAFHEKGYRVETAGREHKEAHLIHPRGTHIDLHFLFAYPHFRGLTDYDRELLKQISHQCLVANRSSGFGLSYPTIEWFMIMKIAGYWYNDLLTGLGPLHTIATICSQPQNTVDWKKLLTLADSVAIRQEILFVLTLCSRVFTFPLPPAIKTVLPLYVRFLAHKQKLADIVVFPPIQSWYHSRHLHESKARFLRFLLLKLVLHQHLPLSLLVAKFRPTKIRLWLPVLLKDGIQKITQRRWLS